MSYNLSFDYIWDYSGVLLSGLGISLFYTAVSLVLGLVLGFLAALARSFGGSMLSFIAVAYIEIFRGTPVLVQLFWFMFCLPALLGIDIGATTGTLITLTLYMGAITSESYRSAFRNIGAEQGDASKALSLSSWVFLVYVVLPQTILLSIPNLLSNSVTLFKESALVSAMGINDLMYNSQHIAESTGRPVEILTVAALVYFVIAFGVTRIVSQVERILLRRLAL